MATITDRTGTFTTETPLRDINDKDKTTVIEKAPPKAPPVARGVAVPVAPRSRTSVWATLSLILGLGATFAAITGTLQGPAIAVGVLAAFAGLGGMSATSRRHIAGRTEALLGMSFGLIAVVVGVLALTGVLPALGPDTDPIGRLAGWLEARLPWMFPS